MLPLREDNPDSLPTSRGNQNKQQNPKPKPLRVLPYPLDRHNTNPTLTSLSPPPVAKDRKLNLKGSHVRLRSDSGLALHTNQAGFRQYTDYNPDGSLPSSRPCPGRSLSWDGDSSAEDISLPTEASTDITSPSSSLTKTPASFFDPMVIKLAFSNPEIEQKLRRFAESRHNARDMEFLAKVRFSFSLIPCTSTAHTHITFRWTSTLVALLL